MSERSTNHELQALLDAGRCAVVAVPSGARDRLEARLGALAGWPAAGPRSASGTRSAAKTGIASGPTAARKALQAAKVASLAKAAVIFVAGATAGVVTKDHLWPSPPRVETRYVDRVVEVERAPVPTAPSLPAVSSVPAAPAVPVVPVPVASGRPLAGHPVTGTDEGLTRERTIIETARSALVRGDASGALTVLAQHASAFPRGQLAETREALAIQALSRMGRADEARSRAERFRRDYPSSVYQTVVDEATGTISP